MNKGFKKEYQKEETVYVRQHYLEELLMFRD